MSKDWKWKSWEEAGDYEEIQGLPKNDHYNGARLIKPGAKNIFNTVVLCVFEFTAINQYFFKEFIPIEMSTHEEIYQEGTPRCTLVTNG